MRRWFTFALVLLAGATSTALSTSGLTESAGAAQAVNAPGGGWHLQNPLSSPSSFADIACPGVSVCYAVGEVSGGLGEGPGVIVGTTDGGATWQRQNAVATEKVGGIACPSTTVCFALTHDHLLLTLDGGQTWTVRGTPEGLTLNFGDGIACPTTTTCYATTGSVPCGVPGHSTGVILMTTDGARSWVVRPTAECGGTNLISCPSASVCYTDGASRTGADIQVTRDSGRTWSILPADSTVGGLFSIACPSTSSCYVAGNSGTLMTRDGGMTWTRRPSLLSGNFAGGIDLSCPSTTVCFASLGSKLGLEPTSIALTDDGGNTWSTRQTSTSGLLTAVDCPSVLICYAVGDDGTILVSVDGGTMWPLRTPGAATTNNLAAVACPSATTCYAVGDAGAIVATTDGGNRWRLQSSGTSARLNAVACPSPTVCYALGQITPDQPGRVVARTTNGGKNWTIHRQNTPLFAIACPRPSICYAVGDAGAVLATIDGGQTWISRKSPTNVPLVGVACATATACSAVGGLGRECDENLDCSSPGQGVLLSTSNGGRRWRRKVVADTNMVAVVCPGSAVCYATGSYEPVGPSNSGYAVHLATVNAGRTWRRKHHGPLASDSNSCPGTTTCYGVAGIDVMETTDAGVTFTSTKISESSVLHGIACPSTQACYAVGDAGTIVASTALPSHKIVR